MTLGYWGIVAGVGALLGGFFLCMELLYANARNTGKDRTVPLAEGETADVNGHVKHHAA